MGNFFAGPCSGDKWRNPDKRLEWSTEFKNTLIEEINATPLHRGIKSSALLVGPVGAGKSSVVNSFLTAGAEKVIRKAEPGSDEKSVTTRFKRYDGIPQIEKYCLCDTAGILDRDNEGLHEEDVLNLMKGHIGSGYKFKEDEPISEDAEEYVAAPDDQDKSHCLAIVIPCMQVKEISDGYREKITNAIRKARNEDIPPVIILTYIDKLCSNVMRNPTKVFSCKHTEEVVDIAEEKFGVPKMYIFPLMNYSSQIVKDDRIDIINLLILKRILEFTSDYSERLVNQGEEHL